MLVYTITAIVLFLNVAVIPRSDGKHFHLNVERDIKKRARLDCEPAPGPWENVPGLKQWCNLNCNHVPSFCPESHCVCE